ncbi:MAG: peptidoglycan-binding domain-containing protein [Patescibacteria group bacterium]
MDLQKLLARDPSIYPEGIVSGLYGPKTVVAVRKFQAKYGLPQVGRVGPATLAKINEVLGAQVSAVAPTTPSVAATAADQIQAQIQAIQSQIQALTSGVSVQTPLAIGAVMIDTELNPGTRSDEVIDLQKLLAKDPEVYPEGTVSGFYGSKTTAAVKKFQAKYGISTVGRVGPATMAKINEVLGSVSTPVVAPSTPMVAPATSNNDLTKQIEDQIKAIQGQINTLTAPSVPVAPVKTAPTPATTSTDDLTKQIEAQIKAIQDQIKALQ